MSVFVWIATVVYVSQAVQARVCTTDEHQSILDAYTADTSAACAFYFGGYTLPCTATDCLNFLEQVVESIPNCTASNTSTYTALDSLLEKLDTCKAEAAMNMWSTTNCTSFEAIDTLSLYLDVAQGDACTSSADIMDFLIVIETSCASTCANALADLEEALPNCVYELQYSVDNKKDFLAQQLTACNAKHNESTISINLPADNDLLSSLTATAAPTPLISGCNATEVQDILNYFLEVATNENCTSINASSICSHEIHVEAACSTGCVQVIDDLWEELPECIYDRQYYYKHLVNVLTSCNNATESVSISFRYEGEISTESTSVSCNPEYDDAPYNRSASSGDSSLETSTANRADWSIWRTSILMVIVCLAT